MGSVSFTRQESVPDNPRKMSVIFLAFPFCFHRHLCHIDKLELVTMHPPNITSNNWNCAAVDANQVGRKVQRA